MATYVDLRCFRPREIRMLGWIADGHTDEEIAELLKNRGVARVGRLTIADFRASPITQALLTQLEEDGFAQIDRAQSLLRRALPLVAAELVSLALESPQAAIRGKFCKAILETQGIGARKEMQRQPDAEAEPPSDAEILEQYRREQELALERSAAAPDVKLH